MTWAYLDDRFPEHPKVVRAGGDAAWLWVCALCWCKRHDEDGRIPKALIGQLSDRRQPQRLAVRLVEVGLWSDTGEFYVFNNWDEWNRSSADRKEKARKAARARWDAPSNAPSNANGNARSIADAYAPGCPSPRPPSPSTQVSSSTHVSGAPGGDDERVSEILKTVAEAKLRRASNVTQPQAWLAKVQRNDRLELGAECRRLLDEFPTAPTSMLAAALLGEKSPHLAHHRRAG